MWIQTSTEAMPFDVIVQSCKVSRLLRSMINIAEWAKCKNKTLEYDDIK